MDCGVGTQFRTVLVTDEIETQYSQHASSLSNRDCNTVPVLSSTETKESSWEPARLRVKVSASPLGPCTGRGSAESAGSGCGCKAEEFSQEFIHHGGHQADVLLYFDSSGNLESVRSRSSGFSLYDPLLQRPLRRCSHESLVEADTTLDVLHVVCMVCDAPLKRLQPMNLILLIQAKRWNRNVNYFHTGALTRPQLCLYAWESIQRSQTNTCPEDVQFHISAETFPSTVECRALRWDSGCGAFLTVQQRTHRQTRALIWQSYLLGK